MSYKKGERVNINVKGDKRQAAVVKDGTDSKDRVRVRIDNFPMDMSIKSEEVVSYV